MVKHIIIVGSGYGGSVCAYNFCRAGYKVILLEKGEYYTKNKFPDNFIKYIFNISLNNIFKNKILNLYIDIFNNTLLANSCGVGGSSLINAGVAMIPPQTTIEKFPELWQKNWQKYMKIALKRLQAKPQKNPSNSAQFHVNLADKCDNAYFPLSTVDTNKLKDGGQHIFGATDGSKASLDKTYLRKALKTGNLKIYTNINVDYIKKLDNNNYKIYYNHNKYITTKILILSAGVVGTTKILFKSKENKTLSVNKYLGCNISFNGDHIVVVKNCKKQLPPHDGCLTDAVIEKNINNIYFSIQNMVIPKILFIIFNYFYTNSIIDYFKFKNLFFDYKKTYTLLLVGADEANGKITWENNIIKIKPPTDSNYDIKIKECKKISKKLGGVLDKTLLKKTNAVHLLGGCNIELCTDELGRLYDKDFDIHENLYIVDASIIPCAITVNPFLSITTIAEIISRDIIKKFENKIT